MVDLKIETIQVASVDGKALQEAITEQLKKEGIRPAFLWGYGIKNCLMGLKFEEESIELVKELSGSEYAFDDPHTFICQVVSKIYEKNICEVKKLEGKILQLKIKTEEH